MIFVIVLVVIVVLLVGYLVVTYNGLVSLRNRIDAAWAQIDVQLKRRYDLIPNLVECVKGYMTHERECLVRVTEARNQAAADLRQAIQSPESAAALQKWAGAEAALTSALGQLSVVIERYPDLKANRAVADLTEQLTSTENRIAYARQAYNDWSTGFNDYREAFADEPRVPVSAILPKWSIPTAKAPVRSDNPDNTDMILCAAAASFSPPVLA
jgi:LemA protein